MLRWLIPHTILPMTWNCLTVDIYVYKNWGGGVTKLAGYNLISRQFLNTFALILLLLIA